MSERENYSWSTAMKQFLGLQSLDRHGIIAWGAIFSTLNRNDKKRVARGVEKIRRAVNAFYTDSDIEFDDHTVTPTGAVTQNSVTTTGTVTQNSVTPTGTVTQNTVTPTGTVTQNSKKEREAERGNTPHTPLKEKGEGKEIALPLRVSAAHARVYARGRFPPAPDALGPQIRAFATGSASTDHRPIAHH